jgi:fido (protein-threonine AMPylation protein)
MKSRQPNNSRTPGTPGRPPREAVYERLHVQIGELRDRLGGLPAPVEAQGIWRDIWLEEAHHSTAIEGNTLVQKQVEKLLAEGRAVGNKELREYMEVQGYGNAADWVYGHGIEPGAWVVEEPMTLTDLRQIHRLALDLVWDVAPHPDATDHERPGNFREHDLEPFPGGMKPPPWPEVPQLIASWLDDAKELPRAEPLAFPEELARVHARFEQIHPFLDGNGRAGRLVLNLLLVRMGYPPAIIYKRERSQYLKALRRADQSDYGALGELLARAILDNLYKFIVPAIAGPARLVPLPALATNRVSADALRVAAARGRLEATKGADGSWRSSRLWVNQYLSARSRKRTRQPQPVSEDRDDVGPPVVAPGQIALIPPDADADGP